MFNRGWPILALIITFGCGARAVENEPTLQSVDTSESLAGEPQTAPEESTVLPAQVQEILAEHNRLRAEHCAPPLTWSPELASIAQQWADGLAARGCSLAHSGGQHGENLFMATAGARTAAEVVGVWYSEKEHYRFGSGGFSMRTGHFTQVVWAQSRALGCANVSCGGMDLWVCNYDPPGNIEGQYRDNVLPTTCRR